MWYEIKIYFRNTKEGLTTWFIWHLPRWLVYRCAIRLISYATVGKYSSQIVPELTAMDALKRWYEDPRTVNQTSHGIPADYAESAE